MAVYFEGGDNTSCLALRSIDEQWMNAQGQGAHLLIWLLFLTHSVPVVLFYILSLLCTVYHLWFFSSSSCRSLWTRALCIKYHLNSLCVFVWRVRLKLGLIAGLLLLRGLLISGCWTESFTVCRMTSVKWAFFELKLLRRFSKNTFSLGILHHEHLK